MRYSLLFLICLFTLKTGLAQPALNHTYSHGAVVRGDSTKKEIALIFTAHDHGEGLPAIIKTLKKQKVKAGFFFTGVFYGTDSCKTTIRQLAADKHYLGPHSNEHLLYCDWKKRDSLLITQQYFTSDLLQNQYAMGRLGLPADTPRLFIPPYEWWNDSIAAWSKSAGYRLVSFTPGMRTNADYTWPEMGTTYKSSEWLVNWLKQLVVADPAKLNGAILLIHAGTDPRRTDKLYNRLAEMIQVLKTAGFRFKRIDKLLAPG